MGGKTTGQVKRVDSDVQSSACWTCLYLRGFFVTGVCSRMGFVRPFGLGFVILVHVHLKFKKAAKIIALRTEEEQDCELCEAVI